LALPVTARNGRFRFPKLNVVGSNAISRSREEVGEEQPLPLSAVNKPAAGVWNAAAFSIRSRSIQARF
jgi:hypothetical protein